MIAIDEDWLVIQRKNIQEIINNKIVNFECAESLTGIVNMIDFIVGNDQFFHSQQEGINKPELSFERKYPHVGNRPNVSLQATHTRKAHEEKR